MRTWMIVAILFGLLIVGGIVLSVTTGGQSVETATAKQEDIREFVDERGKTRLPRTYLVTMPYDGRIESIDLVEGTCVKRDQVIARLVPRDLELNVKAAEKAVERLQASVQENDDTSVEQTGLKQALEFVSSMNRTVEAAKKRVEGGKA